MRVERIEASKHKKDRILVFLEDGACLKITEQELLDFGLRSGDELDEEALKRLKEAAGVSNTRAAAADLIGKRAMSRLCLERKLREKGASEAEARYAAEWLEAIGALNDAEYAAALARHYGGMGYGPARVREKLYEKGIPRELWEDALDGLEPDESRLDKLARQKLRGAEPTRENLKKVSDYLARRGYGWEEISAALDRIRADWPDGA